MLLDGKKVAERIQQNILNKIKNLHPSLTVFLIGDHPASLLYVKKKQEACQKVGILANLVQLPATISEDALVEALQAVKTHGILVQLPLPNHLSLERIAEAIDPTKDVDCFHPFNFGKLALGITSGLLPCTPKGIELLLKSYKIPLKGKEVAILGRSNLVGKPLALLLGRKGVDATVTLAHSETKHLKELTRSADIVIAAMGRPHFLTDAFIKEGAVVIDVGINRLEGRLVGDVDFSSVHSKCHAITPVPGGVGPMTIAALLSNVVIACDPARGPSILEIEAPGDAIDI